MTYAIPTCRDEMLQLGWERPDVIILTGDAFVDHPAFGSAVIARVLQKEGYRVAVADMLDADSRDYVGAFGKPALFYGVTGGNVDSMVSRFTSFKKVRNNDPYRPLDNMGNRPKRSIIVYCNMIKTLHKDVPVIIGGLEASMRRFIHYDYIDNALRRSILLDSRADLLIYGMGEHSIVEAARRIQAGETLTKIPGTVALLKELPEKEYAALPDEEEAASSKEAFAKTFKKIYLEGGDQVLLQKSGSRFLVQYPFHEMSSSELDTVYELPFTREPASKYAGERIPAFEMIQSSINSHRGCASGCAFCSIALHQGRKIISRSEDSVLKEARTIAQKKYCRGHITDVGGPSANMYGTQCTSRKICRRESCIHPSVCTNLKLDSRRWVRLLKKVSALPGIKHVTLGSGIRYDVLMHDSPESLDALVEHHVSGQMKIAPEHSEESVLDAMRKRPVYSLENFVRKFQESCALHSKKYYIIPYLMSNHPGSTLDSMHAMKQRMKKTFGMLPDQVQSFYPLPMTLSSVMYYTGIDPLTGKNIFSETQLERKRRQHELFFETNKNSRKKTGYGKKGHRKRA